MQASYETPGQAAESTPQATHKEFLMTTQNDPVLLAVGVLSREFGLSRDVLRRILSEQSVAPAGQRGGHPVYRLADAFRAVVADGDPDRMSPHARLALARAIFTEDQIRHRRGELLERVDVEQEMAGMVKVVCQTFDALPDLIERDCGATPAVLSKMESCLDKARERLYQRLASADGDAGA
jgi:hypothetical protein